jgi:hypothetical protein
MGPYYSVSTIGYPQAVTAITTGLLCRFDRTEWGNGLLLGFLVDDFEAAYDRAPSLKSAC